MQCYHPPVFYYVSAIIAKVALKGGMNSAQSLMKLLQFVNCLYGILTLGIIFLILNKLKLSDFSKIIAFGTVCFLPRHIYMSAIYSNDTMSYLFVSLCAYLLLITIERHFSTISMMALSFLMTITLFIKYTNLVVIPMVIVTFILAFMFRSIFPRKKALISLILVLIIPSVCLSIYMKNNIIVYGKPLPEPKFMSDAYNMQLRSGEAGIEYFSFTPWKYIKNPIILPGQMSSFWTLIYSGMWFDTEPRFLNFTDINNEWWNSYFGMLHGNGELSAGDPLSLYTHFLGAVLITMGLIPLILLIIGFCKAVFKNWISSPISDPTEVIKLQIFTILMLFNFLGVIKLVHMFPFFNSMKASYVLNSMSAFSVFIALGMTYIDKNAIITKIITLLFLLIFLFVILHIIQIAYAIHLISSNNIIVYMVQ
jgi:4-amino-4-deoxy-L-arabinose transferase-like glycosyltransferase